MKRCQRRRSLFPILLSLILSMFFLLSLKPNQDIQITLREEDGSAQEHKISAIEENGLYYIRLDEFSLKTGYGIYTNEQRQKCVLYLGPDKATFTSDNNFVILNEKVIQSSFFPIWRDQTLWVPLKMMTFLFSENTARRISFDPSQKVLSIFKPHDSNILRVGLKSKENGTVITIKVAENFSEKDITLKVANGWFHIDILGGTVPEDLAARIKPQGLISKVEVIPLDQVVSLAFKLKKRILSKELILHPEEHEIVVNLRSSEKVKTQARNENILEKQKREWLIDTIVIDPGHGGKDPGAIGKGGIKEKDIVLGVGLKLGKIIKKNFPDIKVVFTRNSDVFIPLWRRTQFANEKRGKIFISLHCNSNPNEKAKGFETYFLSADQDKNRQAQNVVLKENASIQFEEAHDQQRYKGVNFILATMAQSAFIRQSQYLASVVQSSMAKKMKPLGLHSRGVRQGRFWVMVGATMPNILIEMGFISNRYEAALLRKRSMQQKMAEAIFEGIRKYKKDIEAAI